MNLIMEVLKLHNMGRPNYDICMQLKLPRYYVEAVIDLDEWNKAKAEFDQRS